MWSILHWRTEESSKAAVFDLGFLSSILIFAFLVRSSWFLQNPLALSVGIFCDAFFTLPLIVGFLFFKSKRLLPSLTLLFSLEFLTLGVAFNPAWDLIPSVGWTSKIFFLASSAVATSICSVLLFRVISRETIEYANRRPQTERQHRIRKCVEEYLGRNAVSNVFATELTTFSYLIGKNLSERLFGVDPKESDDSVVFSYHLKSGLGALLGCLAMVVLMELTAVHFLVSMWNHGLAWVATLSSGYLMIQLIAHFRSLPLRPNVITPETLRLRNGLLMETEIPISEVVSIEKSQKNPDAGEKCLMLSLPASHNVVVTVSKSHSCGVIYGGKVEYDKLLLCVDDPEEFVQLAKDLKNK